VSRINAIALDHRVESAGTLSIARLFHWDVRVARLSSPVTLVLAGGDMSASALVAAVSPLKRRARAGSRGQRAAVRIAARRTLQRLSRANGSEIV